MAQLKNEMKFEFISKSANESFARATIAAFIAQLDPTISEVADIKTAQRSQRGGACSVIRGFMDKLIY